VANAPKGPAEVKDNAAKDEKLAFYRHKIKQVKVFHRQLTLHLHFLSIYLCLFVKNGPFFWSDDVESDFTETDTNAKAFTVEQPGSTVPRFPFLFSSLCCLL